MPVTNDGRKETKSNCPQKIGQNTCIQPTRRRNGCSDGNSHDGDAVPRTGVVWLEVGTGVQEKELSEDELFLEIRCGTRVNYHYAGTDWPVGQE
jgi:hypothetical protein